MAFQSPIIFASPIALAVGAALSIGAIVIASIRRAALPRLARVLLIASLVCLCLAGGGMTWRYQRAERIAVVVDLSSSTRTAQYRAPSRLHARLRELLGGHAYTLYQMGEQTTPLGEDAPLHDISTAQTIYDPPPADAVVLLSDGQFSVPHAVPVTYPVIDPALDHPPDARVEKLEMRGGRIVTTVDNTTGEPRRLTLSNATPSTQPIANGRFVISAEPSSSDGAVWAILHGRDPWPENNSLILRVPPRQQRQRWWVGGRDPGNGWHHLGPGDLPGELAAYLPVAVIVLDNVPVDQLNREQQDVLQRYVRDLGGGMLILGGDQAFAAGGYAGSAIERLSPLASTPPRPMMHWVLLADSSGSMASSIGDNSRWAFASNAVMRLIRVLPPDDILSAGNFARTIRWWRGGVPVRELQRGPLIPQDVRPTGPTNLGPALQIVADSVDPSLPTQLLIITDAEAKIEDPDALIARLKGAGVHVSVLATAEVSPNNPLRKIVAQTGGEMIAQMDPRRWAGDLRRLQRSAAPKLLQARPLAIEITRSGPQWPPFVVPLWNRTWLKSQAVLLARGLPGDHASSTTQPAKAVPAIGAWNVGSGAAIAVAFSPSMELASALAEQVALPPRNPRFTVTWDAGADLVVTLDAYDPASGYINHLSPRLELSSDGRADKSPLRLTQIGPGRYRASSPAPQQSTFASLYADGRPLDRIALPGRYPREFDSIGNNRANLEELAHRSGGEIIEPDRTTPIDFRWPLASALLTPWLAIAGAALLAGGLIRWRLG
jgi:hypothetical protein